MQHRRARTASAVLAAMALAATAAPAAASTPAVTTPVGTLVVPSSVPGGVQDFRTEADGLVGSPSGVAYAHGSADGGETVLVRPIGSASHTGAGLSQTVSMVGDQLLGWSASQPVTLTAVSVSTGASQDLGVTPSSRDITESDTHSLPRGTGTGWLDARFGAAGALVLHSTIGGPTQEFAFPVADVRTVTYGTADAQGFVGTVGYGYGTGQLDGMPDYAGFATYYLDFATGTWTLIPYAGTLLSLSPHDIAWYTSGVIHRVHRSDPAGSAELRFVFSAAALAITDTATAWVQGPVYFDLNAPYTLVTATEPASSPVATVDELLSPRTATQVVALTGNDFAAGFRAGTAGNGVYRVTAGVATIGDELDALPRLPAPIAESTGQQSSVAPDGRTATVARVSVRHGVLSVGPPRVLVAPAGGTIRLVATDGARTAVVSTVGSQSTLTLTGVTTKPWRVPVPLSTYAVTFSGHRLLVADEQSSGAAAFKARSRVLDLSRPTVHWTTEPDLSAISGSLLAYQLNDGSIWLRNLDLPRTHDKRLLPPAPGNDRRVDHGQINISGDWVTWTNWGVGGSTQSGAYRLSTGKVLARPNPRSVLAEGMAAYADDNLAVHLVDLARGTDTPVPGAFSQGGLSLSDEVLSYVDVDNDTVLVPVGSLVAAAPRAVQVSGDTVRVAPVTTKKPLLATYEVSRPLTTWTFAVRSSKGTVVFRTKGSAPTGWLRVAWNGRGSKGRHLPAGRYTWTVTGSGPGGALTGPSGKGKLHGVVRL